MKKLLAMVLAAVMVLSLCSCATAEETVALRVWVGDNADLPWINSVIELQGCASRKDLRHLRGYSG